MANAGGMNHGASGGPVRHIPVLLREILSVVRPESGMIVLDGTFGAGGYSRAFLEAGANVVALDRDPEAVASARPMIGAYAGLLTVIQDRFSNLASHAPASGLDAVVLDIGVSSMQIDEAARGFSFRDEGPLDMRMAADGPTAADVVNTYRTGDLARIFGFLGEEKNAGRIARAIVGRRAERTFATTTDLATLIEGVAPRKARDKIHPATRVFQALRIYVNEELQELADALFAAERVLKPGGRLAVVTFHSLEDRIVKRFLRDRAGRSGGSRHLPQVDTVPSTFETSGKGMISPGTDEIEINPRARSAKLRAGIRTDAEARSADLSIFGLPRLPSIHEAVR